MTTSVVVAEGSVDKQDDGHGDAMYPFMSSLVPSPCLFIPARGHRAEGSVDKQDDEHGETMRRKA